MDWADEIANKLADEWLFFSGDESGGYVPDRAQLSAALRKARDDALEEAACAIGEIETRFDELTQEALDMKQDNRASRSGSVALEMNRAARTIRSLKGA